MTAETLPDELVRAREGARLDGLRESAVCYITRGGRELLVFEHTAEYPDAGVQVPGGGIEPGETPHAGAIREASEETGLTDLSTPVYLGSRLRVRQDAGQPVRAMRHYFWLQAPATTPDAWAHRVSAGQEDAGMTFRLRFAPLDQSGLDWDFDELLAALRRQMETTL